MFSHLGAHAIQLQYRNYKSLLVFPLSLKVGKKQKKSSSLSKERKSCYLKIIYNSVAKRRLTYLTKVEGFKRMYV